MPGGTGGTSCPSPVSTPAVQDSLASLPGPAQRKASLQARTRRRGGEGGTLRRRPPQGGCLPQTRFSPASGTCVLACFARAGTKTAQASDPALHTLVLPFNLTVSAARSGQRRAERRSRPENSWHCPRPTRGSNWSATHALPHFLHSGAPAVTGQEAWGVGGTPCPPRSTPERLTQPLEPGMAGGSGHRRGPSELKG